jgi:hypothetical protein
VNSGLTQGTKYFYQVAASTSGGVGIKSAEVSVIPGRDMPGNAAQLVEWVGYQLYSYTDAQLTYMAQTLGIFGLLLAANFDWHGTPAAIVPGSVQEAIHGSNVIARAKSKGFEKIYLGFGSSNPTSTAPTPYADWFDDAAWGFVVIPQVMNQAAAAKFMGFAGLGFDDEEYGRNDGNRMSWGWGYIGYATSSSSQSTTTGSKTFATQAGKVWSPGDRVWIESPAYPFPYLVGTVTSYSGTTLVVNVDTQDPGRGTGVVTSANWWISKPEALVRAKVKQRGAEMMTAILSQFPDVEITTYYANFAGGFRALLANVVNGRPLDELATRQVMIDFWDGMTSVPGYSRIRFGESAFYTATGSISGSPDMRTCMTLNVNGILAYLSQNLSNWKYANQRVTMSPMTWMGPSNGEGVGTYAADNMQTPAQSLVMVQNMRIHGMSECANFTLDPEPNTMVPPASDPGGSYADFTMTNNRVVHGNYVPAYAAAVTGIVDSTDPTLSGITIVRDNASTIHAFGTADDNLGIRAIRWVSGGNTGAAIHVFVIEGGGTYQTAYASFAWHVAWVANGIPATAGQTVTFAVEDIKGHVKLYPRVV